MLEQTYHILRKQLAAEGTFYVNNLYGAITVLVELSFFTIGITLLLQASHFSLSYWILQILLGISMFRFFVILHECGHKTLFCQKYLNTIVGLLVSPICLIPYIPWRNIHYEHHRWVGVIDKDPTQAHLLKLKVSSKTQNFFRLIWKTWIPIGFIKFIFDVFWMYPIHEFNKGNRAKTWDGFVSLLIASLPHIILIVYFGIIDYLILFGPMLLMFYIWIENMNLPQHSGLFPYLSQNHPDPIPHHAQDSITRTTHLPPILSVLFAYNFNLHTEHHLFPTAPWYSLPRVKQKIQGVTDLEYNEAEFLKFMIDLRSQDPIDIYVKSLPWHDEI